MIITKQESINSCHDIELGIEREQELVYTYSYPDNVILNGIVFLIHGYGANVDYMNNLRESTALEFNVLAVDVYYHCFFSRPENGATIEFNPDDLVVLQKVIDGFKVDFSEVEEITVESVLDTIHRHIEEKKIRGDLPNNFKLELPATIIPKNNEYQNFGFMQAIDHINVLLELEKKEFNFLEGYTRTLMGSSHGGYLAHLIAKFAPHKIDSVIDNSSYATPMLDFIVEADYRSFYGNVTLNTCVQTYWNLNQESKYFFSDDRHRIRDLNDELQLKEQTKFSSCETIYVSYHSKFDGLASIDEKTNLYKMLNFYGYKAKLHTIDSESLVDGKFIKSLDHGMEMSLKELLKRELPEMLQHRRVHDKQEFEIIYLCKTKSYKFTYGDGDLDINICER